jgi:hypothetical protein
VLNLEAVHMLMDFLKLSGDLQFEFRKLEPLIKTFGVTEPQLLGSKPNNEGQDVYYYHDYESGAG